MENKEFVQSRYPDAKEFKVAKLSMAIWCPLLNRRISGYFHTFEEAWADAVEWIKRNESRKRLNP